MLSKFKEILAEADYDVYVLQTDQGTEFVALKKFFKDEGIHLVFKAGQNKVKTRRFVPDLFLTQFFRPTSQNQQLKC